MRVRWILACVLSAGLLTGGCSSYGFLPDTAKVPEPVLNRPDQLDTIKAMRDAAQTHGTDAAKKIETTR
jgi:outer membrane murein-binding lipoprotein Lpp